MNKTFSIAALVASQLLFSAIAPGAFGADAPAAPAPATRADQGKGAENNSEKDRTIQPKDKLTVSLEGLDAPGRAAVFKLVVDERGLLKLPYVKEPLTAKGLTPKQLQAAIDKAYSDAALLQVANSSVSVEPGKDTDSDRVVRPKDRLTISVRDLEAPGKDTIIKAVVDDKGDITLPYVKEPVRVKDLTCAKVEEAVAKAYRDARLIVETVVKVVIAKDAKEQKP